MLAREKDNTIAKNRQKIRVLTMCEQTLISNNKLEYGHVAKIFELLM